MKLLHSGGPQHSRTLHVLDLANLHFAISPLPLFIVCYPKDIYLHFFPQAYLSKVVPSQLNFLDGHY